METLPTCRIRYLNSPLPDLTIPSGKALFEVLTLQNSPILFGCRTGICGTCLVTVQGKISPPDPDEQELLEILAPDIPNARLACQIHVTHDIDIQRLPCSL